MKWKLVDALCANFESQNITLGFMTFFRCEDAPHEINFKPYTNLTISDYANVRQNLVSVWCIWIRSNKQFTAFTYERPKCQLKFHDTLLVKLQFIICPCIWLGMKKFFFQLYSVRWSIVIRYLCAFVIINFSLDR